MSDEIYLHRDVEQQCRERLTDRLATPDGLTMSEIRDILQTTRKYAVPFCEYLDRIGFTERRGDNRVLGRSAQSAHEDDTPEQLVNGPTSP